MVYNSQDHSKGLFTWRTHLPPARRKYAVHKKEHRADSRATCDLPNSTELSYCFHWQGCPYLTDVSVQNQKRWSYRTPATDAEAALVLAGSNCCGMFNRVQQVQHVYSGQSEVSPIPPVNFVTRGRPVVCRHRYIKDPRWLYRWHS